MSSSQTTGGKKRISYSSQYVPDMLKEQQIWCCFKVKPRPDGRMTKIPCTPTSEAIVGEIGSSAHRSQLVGYEEAVAAYQKNPHTFGGIGFFTDKQLGIVLADFDNCYDEDGSLHPYVEMALTMLDSYTEESLSGTGKHCLFVGELPGDKKVFKDDGIELYDTHFVVWTENRDGHYPVTIESRQRELDVVYKDLRNRQALRKKGQPKQVAEENAIPCVLPLSLSDGELIEKARAAKGRAGADFVRLHDRGDIAGFTHPDGTVDPSRADFRLFSLLAFWSGRDPVQMERIAKTSAIYRPERWEKGNYLDRTIAAAIAKCPTVYTGAGKRGTGVESTEFEGMFWRIMSHTELSINRRLALLAIAVEYKSNLHKMDEKGFVPICYRFMSKWCHINEQALCDAGSVAASYKLLEKKHNQKGGEDFKINLRVKMSEDVAQCRFPTLEQTKKPGGKRVKCPSCATEEVEIWSKSTTSIICCNPDCDHYGEVREIHTHTKKKQQRAKTPQEEPLQQYHCTLPTAIEETRPVSQLDVQRNYGESGIIPPCDTHVSQLDGQEGAYDVNFGIKLVKIC